MTEEPLISYADALALDAGNDTDHIPTGASSNPRLMTMRQLGAMRFPPIKWVVPGFIVEGATILAGRPKLGKRGWFSKLHLPLPVAPIVSGMPVARRAMSSSWRLRIITAASRAGSTR